MKRERSRRQRASLCVLFATGALIACGGSSTGVIQRTRQHGGAGGIGAADSSGRGGAMSSAAGTAAHAGGTVTLGGSAGRTTVPSAGSGHGGAGTEAGAGAAGDDQAGFGGAEPAGSGGSGIAGGGAGGAGFAGQGGVTNHGGSSSGGRASGGASGAGGQVTCAESIATYCGVSGGAGASECPANWSEASNPTRWCSEYPRVFVFDCGDEQALVTAGVDTSTTYFFDPETHALVEVYENANGRTKCGAGPATALYTTEPSCTPTMPCAGTGGRAN